MEPIVGEVAPVSLTVLLYVSALTAMLFGAGMLLLASVSAFRYRQVLVRIGVADMCFSIAILLLALRGSQPSAATLLLPALLTFCGIALWHHGISLLLQLETKGRENWFVALLVLAVMTPADALFDNRVLASAALFSGLAWLMLRHAWAVFRALDAVVGMTFRLAIVAPTLIFGFFALARVITLVVLPADGSPLFVDQPSLTNILLFLIVFMNLVGLNVGFGLMIGLKMVRLTESLHYQMRHDLLTGLFNRRAIMEFIEREIARQSRGAAPFSILLVDLDHFKRFNDRHGHLAGDAALIHAANVMKGAARAEDIVARFGGEEFCILLPDTLASAAQLAAERIRSVLAASPLSIDAEGGEALTTSIGVATHDDAQEPWDSLYRRADSALYEAKRAGRDRVMEALPFRGSPAMEAAMVSVEVPG
jgi:diguanylate cyclase (GGDEF)-like protein